VAPGRPVQVPRICFINKLDRTGRSFDFCVETIKNRLNAVPAVLQLPIGSEANFIGVVDLVRMRALTWRGETTIGEDYTVEEIPADMLERAQAAHHELVELVADYDDSLMEAYLTDETAIDPDVLQMAVRRAVLSSQITAVLCGSAFKNKGVQPLLDAVIAYLPAPTDVGAIDGFKPGDESVKIERNASDSDPFSALAFKIAADPHLGRLTYIRLYSGTLEAGSTVLQLTKGRKERIGKIYQMHANKRQEIDSVGAGRSSPCMGLKDTTTGETLSDPANPVQLESMDFPAPVIEQAIEPKTKSDQEKLGTAIQRPGRGGPDLPGAHRRRDRSDDHRRHGRAAPGGADRPDEARVPGRGQHRQAAGGLPGDPAPPGAEESTTCTRSSPGGSGSTPR
jgi:elongation factor G